MIRALFAVIFIVVSGSVYAQDGASHEKIFYSAADSIVADKDNRIIRLFGNAEFKAGNVNFSAKKITIDKEKQEIVAEDFIVYAAPGVRSSVMAGKKRLIYRLGNNYISVE